MILPKFQYTDIKCSNNYILALNGQPSIKDSKDHLVPNNTVYHLTPGDNVMFTCEGVTGKPRIPILWMESNGTAEKVLKDADGVAAGTRSFSRMSHKMYQYAFVWTQQVNCFSLFCFLGRFGNHSRR